MTNNGGVSNDGNLINAPRSGHDRPWSLNGTEEKNWSALEITLWRNVQDTTFFFFLIAIIFISIEIRRNLSWKDRFEVIRRTYKWNAIKYLGSIERWTIDKDKPMQFLIASLMYHLPRYCYLFVYKIIIIATTDTTFKFNTLSSRHRVNYQPVTLSFQLGIFAQTSWKRKRYT